MVGIIINIGALCIFVYIAFNYTKAFIAAEGTTIQRMWAAAQESATIMWSQLVILMAAIIGLMAQLGDVLQTGLGDQLKAAIPPEYAASAAILVMAVTIVARMRSISK